jgi:hypothetical protein
LNTTPTAENTLRTLPAHTGQLDAAGSLNDCTNSKRLPQSGLVHAYWYVGMRSSGSFARPRAML